MTLRTRIRKEQITSGSAQDGYKLTADGVGGVSWEFGGSAEIAIDDVSNPPTEAQLITAFGTPDAFANDRKIGVVNDAASGNSAYAVFSDGGHYWLLPLAKATETILSVEVMSSTTIAETVDGNWYGRAELQDLGNGTWVLVYREGTSHPSHDGVIHIRFTNDYCSTWTAEDTDLDGNAVSEFPAYPDGAAPEDGYEAGIALLILAPNGTLYMFVQKVDYAIPLYDGTYYKTSTDNGVTWSASWTKLEIDGHDSTFHGDYFILDGDIYAVGSDETGDDYLFKSSDNGSIWETVSIIAEEEDSVGEPGMEYLGNSTILVIFRDNGNAKTYKTISTDMGETWSALTEIQSAVEVLGRPRLSTRAHLKGYANWWTDSVIIMAAYEHITPGDSTPRRNAVWISQDRGDTWDGPNYTDAETEDAGYGDIAYDAMNGYYVYIVTQGTQAAASVKQYNLTITGI